MTSPPAGYGFPQSSSVHPHSITVQPTAMNPTSAMGGGRPAAGRVPAGLEYLSQIDQLLLQQKKEMLEIFTGFESANRYTVKNSMGQDIYFAVEDNNCCTRNCCGPSRPFDMKIMDHQHREVIHLERPLRCQGCCWPCCLQELEVRSGGLLLGMVKETWSIMTPTFDVLDDAGRAVLKIKGACCGCALCSDVEFQVLSADGDQRVGRITKQWSGLAKELFTDADNFGVNFPIDLDVKTKATLLGATFLIDFMFFEKKK